MKITTLQYERIQLSIQHTPILLDRLQLFFLESFLKKNVNGLNIIKGFELINGKIQFEICSTPEVSNIDEILKKVIQYLLIFQIEDREFDGGKRVVKVERSGYATRVDLPKKLGGSIGINKL